MQNLKKKRMINIKRARNKENFNTVNAPHQINFQPSQISSSEPQYVRKIQKSSF